MFGLVMQTTQPLDASAPVTWAEVPLRYQPFVAECDALYKALMRLRQAVLLQQVEEARQAVADLTDAHTAVTQLVPDLFEGRS